MKTLPADVYDTMELIAEAYGGIGAGRTFVNMYDEFEDNGYTDKFSWEYPDMKPMCIIGFCQFLEHKLFPDMFLLFLDLSITARESNLVVYNHLGIKDKTGYGYVSEYAKNPTRISWQEWCDELGVVRGK